ncbi:2TM domain-containing protein [Flavobacterium agricola]|uniref:2TM domain-containing protein n=1 Tax=Flavobacterium agricola TaxID=2870839 RepID=A0ABY6LYN4_9FLAO|nr:2TM domain-containing protein [Flavobacterium agricola]UYW01349.1 2TM domain-containing protein [Flavobacterium agricola]
MKPNSEEFQQYEYARKRTQAKKNVYYHFITLLIGCAFMYIANNWLGVFPEYKWYIWASFAWLFIFILHVIQVFITNRFMGKKWEQAQIEKLVKKQQEKMAVLEKQVEKQMLDEQNQP